MTDERVIDHNVLEPSGSRGRNLGFTPTRGVGLVGFVQIIEYRTSKIDEMQRVGEEWEQAAAGESKA